MDFVTPIITPIVESLMVPVKKHLGFLVSSTKHVKEMGEKIEQLNVTAKDIQEKEEATAAKSQVVPREASKWLKDVKNLNEEAESITPTAAIGCLNVATRYKAGKRSCDILKKIDDLKTRKSEIEWTNDQIPLGMVTSSTFVPVHDGDGDGDGTHNNFSSRDLIFKAALKSLQPDNETQKMIALCGMGGVGKTTMMEQLKKAVEDSKMFDWVVKVVLGEDTNPITIQEAIAEKLGGALTETAVDARADRLHKMFEGTSQDGKKKILVIMDDVWKEVKLKDFGLTSPLPNGFKLLFTSRFRNVCTQMGVEAESILNVGVLNDAEAKTLFFEIVGRDGDDPQMHKIGEEIVNKCGGLPIAIKTIASILRDEIEEAWEAALSRLENHDLQDLGGIVENIFEMSYNSLKKDLDKAIFLLSGLFPDDHDIPVEDLLRYGWGLDFFKNVKILATARRDTKISVSNLMRANLLTESDRTGCIKMHDLTRDFVLSNFSTLKQASILNHDSMPMQLLTEDRNDSYERILIKCEGMSQFPLDFDYPNLSLLMLMDGDKGLKFRKDFFDRMRKLEVVSYERMHTPLLPVMFECSTKLRTLCFRSCSLMDDFSFLGSLKNLETLSFADCKIRKLPSSIGELYRLKLLDVTGCVDLTIDDGVFLNLVSLEDLYMKVFKNKAVRFTDANCDELKVLSRGLLALELEFFKNKAQPKNVSFTQLKRFRISIGCELEYLRDYSFRNTLNLVADCYDLRECKISGLFEKTEELYLQVNEMNGIEDVSTMHLSQHSFCNLRNLVVSNCLDLTYLFTIPVASGLKKLERLKISNCPKLVSLCDMPDNAIELPEVVELILDGLPNFTSIYPDNINASAMQSFLNKEVVIPKLEKLYISLMENLKQIWPCQIAATNDENNVSMLREIRVRECDNLVNLFPSNPLPLLNHLEELQVGECGSIDVLFNIDLECVCEMGEESSNRLRKIEVDRLEKLRELWRIRGLNRNSDILINAFKGVERIEITNCKKFTNIFTPPTTNFDLGTVTTYIARITGQDLEQKAGKNKLVECSQETDVITFEGEISKLVDENIPNITYTSHIVHTCHNLQHLDLYKDPRVEVVFEMDTPSGRELASIRDTQQPPHLLLLTHHLKFLKLDSLRDMSHVWRCNWNKFSVPQKLEFPFYNLTEISLKDCHKIKYLFSPLMAKFLSSLKYVEIKRCNDMEEVISSRDDEMCATSTSSHTTNTTYFPHLSTLHLCSLTYLQRIDDHTQDAQVISASNWSLCQYPKKITVWECDALSSVIPWYAVGQMKKLERLDIWKCTSITEVFESESSMNDMMSCSNATIPEGSATASASGGTLTRRLKNITVPQLSSLKRVDIHGCDLLEHVFTFSALESLKQLKTLSVRTCEAAQVIVKEEDDDEEINGNTSSSSAAAVVVVFPRLETLELIDLPNLEGFFLGNINIDFRWPLLEEVKIRYCPQMSVFTSGESKTPKLNYLHTGLGKHTLEECGLNFHGSGKHDDYQTTLFSSSDPTILKEMPWSFHNLIEIDLRYSDIQTIIPSNALLHLQKLEKIYLEGFDEVKEVFEVGSLEGTKSESQTVVKIPNLREVELKNLNLHYIWKSNQWMVLEFPNLTSVSIGWCGKLEHVFTCSMAGSLVQLQYLDIRYSSNIKGIVKEEELKEEGDDTNLNKTVLLPRLKCIKLEYLQSFEGFCLGKEAFSWPLLDTLEIKECPRIQVFTKGHLATPELEVIDTSFGMCYVKKDLNSFIKTKQEEGYEF